MFRLQHQFNNIVETAQLNNDLMPEFHCHCECLKFSLPAPSYNISLQSVIREIFYSLVDRSLWQVTPDNLKRFLEFGACFRLCFKLAVNLQHCTPYDSPLGLYSANLEAICLSWWYLDSWPAAGSVRCAPLRAVCADATSCWKMNLVGSQRLL